MIPRILIYLLSISCFSTVVHAEIIEERGSLLEFFAGIEEGCEYDNWLSHVSEGIANAGYNVYAPVEHDRQTNGFGAYQIIDHLENPEEILVSWYDIFANVLSDQIEEADEILSNSAFADYYQIVRLQDGDRSYIILRELLNNEYVDDNGTEDDNDDVTGSFDYGWGLFIFNPDPTTPKVAIEVPHPCDDYVTPFVAIDAFLLLDARALIVSGAGREVEWTEEGEFNNGITRSDPTRLQNVSAFQEAHKAFADSVDNELIIQIHSYDSAGRVLPQSILSAVLDDEPNPPILDFANKFDIVSLTPLVPIAPNSIGNADHDSVSIRDFYSVFYNGGYYYDDEILISNSIGSLQGWDSPQARYSQLEHNPLEDDENFLHIEHDELPDVIREEILEFYPAEGVPTHNTYANAVEFYRPLYTAVGEYYHKSRFHNVPEEFETIQSSIDESFGGDTILVQPGIYTENINFRGKNLLLTSLYSLDGNRSFVNRTVINGNNSASVITFNGGEGVTAVLQGFTITNGSFENGGGIYCVDSSPTLDHCLIFGNRADAVGGAIFCQNSGPIILNCTISDNTSTEGGGAIFGWNGSEISIKNSILWDNSPEEISFLRFGDHNLLNLSFTDLAGGIEEIVLRGNAEVRAGDGNIEVDPLFADAQGSNYFLVLNSPCIDAGDPESPMDADSSRSDIGALPLQSQEISISHDVLDFDEVYLGRIDSLGLTITNIGQSPLTIFSLTVIPEVSLFTISGEMEDIKIEAESEHVTWVYFLADQADDYMAVLQIISDDLERDSIYVQMRATALTVKPDNEPTVHTFGLNNIYPNPFNSMAVVNYSLSLSGNMRIATYDIGGRLHSILKEGFSDAGRYDIEINASDLSTGVYFIKLETETELAVHKFVVVR